MGSILCLPDCTCRKHRPAWSKAGANRLYQALLETPIEAGGASLGARLSTRRAKEDVSSVLIGWVLWRSMLRSPCGRDEES